MQVIARRMQFMLIYHVVLCGMLVVGLLSCANSGSPSARQNDSVKARAFNSHLPLDVRRIIDEINKVGIASLIEDWPSTMTPPVSSESSVWRASLSPREHDYAIDLSHYVLWVKRDTKEFWVQHLAGFSGNVRWYGPAVLSAKNEIKVIKNSNGR